MPRTGKTAKPVVTLSSTRLARIGNQAIYAVRLSSIGIPMARIATTAAPGGFQDHALARRNGVATHTAERLTVAEIHTRGPAGTATLPASRRMPNTVEHLRYDKGLAFGMAELHDLPEPTAIFA